jgi:hypothetical protein
MGLSSANGVMQLSTDYDLRHSHPELYPLGTEIAAKPSISVARSSPDYTNTTPPSVPPTQSTRHDPSLTPLPLQPSYARACSSAAPATNSSASPSSPGSACAAPTGSGAPTPPSAAVCPLHALSPSALSSSTPGGSPACGAADKRGTRPSPYTAFTPSAAGCPPTPRHAPRCLPPPSPVHDTSEPLLAAEWTYSAAASTPPPEKTHPNPARPYKAPLTPAPPWA